MFEAPSAQPGDSPPRPHGLQQTLSPLSLSLLIYGSPSPCKKYRIYCNIRKYTKKYSIHIDIDIRYTYIYIQNKYIHTAYKPPRASNIHVKQCKTLCWRQIHQDLLNKSTLRNGEQSYFNVPVCHGRAHKMPKPYSFPLRSQYQTLSSTWAPMSDLLENNHSNLWFRYPILYFVSIDICRHQQQQYSFPPNKIQKRKKTA